MVNVHDVDFPKGAWHSKNYEELYIAVSFENIEEIYKMRNVLYIKSTTGRIIAKINPGFVERPYRTLKTETTTGLVEIDFLRSLGMTATSMETIHTSTSGSYRANFPDDWKGRIEIKLGPHAKFAFKSIDQAEEVRVIGDNTDSATGKRHIVALKGVEGENSSGSTMNLETESGTIKIAFEKMGPPSEKEAILGQVPAYEGMSIAGGDGLPAYSDIGNAVSSSYPVEKEKAGWVTSESERESTDEPQNRNTGRYRY